MLKTGESVAAAEVLASVAQIIDGPMPELLERLPAQALAALSHLDKKLGTDHAQRFLAEGGLWQRWPGSADYSLAEQQEYLRYDVALATGGDPGVRRLLKLERQEERRNSRA